MKEDRIQRRISSLLTLAAHEGTPENERQRAQEQADELMAKYNIQQALLNWEKPIESRRKPTSMFIPWLNLTDASSTLVSSRAGLEYNVSGTVRGMQSNTYRFAGVRIKEGHFENPETGKKEFGSMVVGYEEDIYYGELLWNIVMQELLRTMFPGWKESRSFDENVYLLKNAGYSWPQIREMGIAHNAGDHNGLLTEKNAGSKLRTAYGREAKRRGEDPKPKLIRDPYWWRFSYVDSFSARLSQRYAALKRGREEYATADNLPALQEQEEAVDQKFWEMFPEEHPDEIERRRKEYEERIKDLKIRPRKPRLRYYDNDAWTQGYNAAERVKITQDRQFDTKKGLN